MSEPRNMLRDGRNIIPVSNSNAKCMLENWVEERAVQKIDPNVELKGNITSMLQVLRHGHKALLTNDYNAKFEDKTTVRVTYTPQIPDATRKVGCKKELMQKMYFNKVCEDKHVEDDPGPEPTDFRSIKTVDYDFDFLPQKSAHTKTHNYRREQPVTFWTEHKDKVHGVTAIKTGDTVFRRNDSFSKPIFEWWEEPQPYELENYPKM
ncbi:hypothetical protein ACOMHN_062538 [Nucella lapillus]